MNIRNIRVTVGADIRDSFRKFGEMWEKAARGEKITPDYQLNFANIATLRRVLTEKRLELLRAIKKHEPDSVYELAKIVDRDLKSVNTDLKVLVDYMLVSLEKNTEERKKTKPEILIDKLSVDIIF